MSAQLFIGLAGVLVAVVLVALALAGTPEAVTTVEMDSGEAIPVNTRQSELESPFAERALAPFVRAFTRLGRKYTPTGYVDGIRKKFAASGIQTTETVDRFLAIRVITVVAIPVVWALVIFGTHLAGIMRLSVLLLGSMALLLGPDAVLNRRVAERKLEVQRKLPEIMDLLVISVEAGLGFEQALDRCVQVVPGPLSDEFNRMLGETRAGSTRADAMRQMNDRVNVPELRAFVLAIVQADTFGVSIGRVLRAQADEMRVKRRQLAQERAMKAPVKMLVPMVFCIFPSLFVITLGPAVINIINNFK